MLKLIATLLAICATLITGIANSDETARTTPAEMLRSSEKQKRLREGTVLNERLGRFRSSESLFWFREINGGREMRVLENLALERISRALPELPADRTWAVTGTVTEYQGENYLLITRSVLKSVADSAGVGTVE